MVKKILFLVHPCSGIILVFTVHVDVYPVLSGLSPKPNMLILYSMNAHVKHFWLETSSSKYKDQYDFYNIFHTFFSFFPWALNVVQVYYYMYSVYIDWNK